MKQKNRDDFVEVIKKKLRDRVGARCSIPDCRAPTVGPSGDDGVSSIGVAAHITAAASGGPRYDPSLDSQQRSAFKNGIWLCSNHATLIDRDETAYPEPLLRSWKTRAESSAKHEQGSKLPSNVDSINTLVAALNSTSGTAIPNAVPNVHRAASRAYENLDPRFHVDSSYTNGVTQFSIAAKEPVELSLTFDRAKEPDLVSKFAGLRAHGRDFDIAASAVSIHGSPLWDSIAAETYAGRFKLVPSRRSVRQKLWAQYAGQSERHFFDDIDGSLAGGTESIHYRANGWGGLFSISMDVPLGSQIADTKFETIFDFQSWHMVDLRWLPYLNCLTNLMRHLAAGAELFLSLEADGNPVLTSKSINFSNQKWVSNLHTLLEYIKLARSLMAVMSQPIKFDAEQDITGEDFRALVDMERIAAGRFRFTKEHITSNPRITAVSSDNGASFLARASSQNVIQLREQPTPSIKIFGQLVALPHRITTMGPAEIKLPSGNHQRAMAGQEIEIEVVMLENFQLSVEFKKTS
jgi:hypothetical protein